MTISFDEFCRRGRAKRQENLSPERRKEIASDAAKARWKKRKKKPAVSA